MKKNIIIVGLIFSAVLDNSYLYASDAFEPVVKERRTSLPRAEVRPSSKTMHGITFHDNFAWLRDPAWKNSEDGVKDPDVMAYLKQEEDYTAQFLEPLESMVEAYIARRKAMIAPQVDTYPVYRNGYYYFVRQGSQFQYPIYYRYPAHGNKEQAVAYFDTNREAQGHEFFAAEGMEVSPNGRYLSYAIDLEGHENYSLRIRDLLTGQDLGETMEKVDPEVVWTPDSQGLYYVVRDEFDRPHHVFFHRFGTAVAEDTLVYSEKDATTQMQIVNTSDHKYLIVTTSTQDEGELWGLELGKEDGRPVRQLIERKPNRKVMLEHRDGFFYILTNDTGPNNRIVRVPSSQLSNETAWEELVPTRPDVYITDMDISAKGIGIRAQKDGLGQIGVLNEKTGEIRYLTMPDKAYEARLIGMPYETAFLRFAYSSLSSPESVLEANFETLQTFVRYVREVPCGHNPADYVTERWFAQARDGAQVPVSLIYKRGRFQANGKSPVLLYGYGAYGVIKESNFDTRFLPYLDHGFAYAIAHVRGGAEMGYSWYLDGKMGKKQNTFNDFIDVARELINKGYVAKGNISAIGGSAGGILTGAIANQAPELFRSVVSIVPCMDLLNTMLDSTLSLTVPEYTEWGNPEASVTDFRNIQSYAPYENMRAGLPYPAMFVTGGIYDSRVTYWEPLKYVAKMRHISPETPIWLQMKTAGHFGGVSLDETLREWAEIYAFILKIHGIIQ